MIVWYDKQGVPLCEDSFHSDRAQWLKNMKNVEKLLSDPDYKIVASDRKGDVHLSTVWLGIDHDYSWSSDEPNPNPIIFETMIFGGERDGEQWRYATEKEAKKKHEQLRKELFE